MHACICIYLEASVAVFLKAVLEPFVETGGNPAVELSVFVIVEFLLLFAFYVRILGLFAHVESLPGSLFLP